MNEFRVSLELTNCCNFRCLICPHDKPELFVRSLGYITEDLFDYAVAQCNKYADTVEFGFFGEQLLHPKYEYFLGKLKKRSFKISVNTNLSLCSYSTFKLWRDIGVDDVRLSLDASCADTFNHCRPGNVKDLEGNPVPDKLRFYRVAEKVAYWLALPGRTNPTRLVFVKSSNNKNEREKFISLWRPKLKNVDHILFKQVVSYGGKIKDPFVQPGTCNIWKNKYAIIGWDGRVSPCNLDVNLQLAIGNIKDNDLYKLYYGNADLRNKTGCGKDIQPCKSCVDSNNWTQNEKVFR